MLRKKSLLSRLWSEKVLYLLILPTILYFVIFKVLPIWNLRLAFFKYSARSDWQWVGLKYFKMVFSSSAFPQILKNTIIISFMKYVMLFPFFVIFAICLNELWSSSYRKVVQVVSYLPHFLSWVVIAGIWISVLSKEGAVNTIRGFFGFAPVDYMTERSAIRWILFLCEGWRSLGWDSIIYFTAILGINHSLYEAVAIDGGGRMAVIRYVILPALVTPMTTMFIMNLGFFMNAGFDQVLNFSNNAVQSTIDILDTYIYRIGIEGGQYSIASVVSLIKGVVGMALVFGTHILSKKTTGEGVW